MCENCFNKLQRDSNVIFFKVINDSFCLLTSLISECNGALKQIENVDKLKEFVANKSEMLFQFVKFYEIVVQKSNFKFSIFHYFKNEDFIKFLKESLDLHFLIQPVINVSFPLLK